MGEKIGNLETFESLEKNWKTSKNLEDRKKIDKLEKFWYFEKNWKFGENL